MRNSLGITCFPAAKSELALPKCAFEAARQPPAHRAQRCEGKGVRLKPDPVSFPPVVSPSEAEVVAALAGRDCSPRRTQKEHVCVHNAWRQRRVSSTWFTSAFHSVHSFNLLSNISTTPGSDCLCDRPQLCFLLNKNRATHVCGSLFCFRRNAFLVYPSYSSSLSPTLRLSLNWRWNCSVYSTGWEKYVRHRSFGC